jgi:uncharacterized protein
MSENFTLIPALIGGLMIGAASSLLWLGIGRLAGLSGIMGRALQGADGIERTWRILFLIGLPAGAGLAFLLGWAKWPSAPPDRFGLIIISGLLVGFGSRLGSGCTSGHGISGLARLSPRSLAATLIFTTAGMASVFVLRHLIGA